MKKIIFGAGWAVFIIFFGIAVIEAFRQFNVPAIFFWLAIGTLFIIADNINKNKSSQT